MATTESLGTLIVRACSVGSCAFPDGDAHSVSLRPADERGRFWACLTYWERGALCDSDEQLGMGEDDAVLMVIANLETIVEERRAEG